MCVCVYCTHTYTGSGCVAACPGAAETESPEVNALVWPQSCLKDGKGKCLLDIFHFKFQVHRVYSSNQLVPHNEEQDTPGLVKQAFDPHLSSTTLSFKSLVATYI